MAAFLSLEISKTVSISAAAAKGKPWLGATMQTIDRTDFVELKKGDKEFTGWLTSCRAYSKRVSCVVDELRGMQIDASKTTLGYVDKSSESKSEYRQRLESKALRRLQDGSQSPFVAIVLPRIEYDGIEVNEVHTTMPLNI